MRSALLVARGVEEAKADMDCQTLKNQLKLFGRKFDDRTVVVGGSWTTLGERLWTVSWDRAALIAWLLPSTRPEALALAMAAVDARTG